MRKILVLLIVLVGHVVLLGAVYLFGGKGEGTDQAAKNNIEDSRPGSFEQSENQPAETEELSLVDAVEDQEIVHVVQRGDYMSTIALKYGVPVNELCVHNNITDPGKIRIGQKILIPTK